VLDHHLAKHDFVAESYSIADIATYPWIVPYEKQGQDLNEFPHLTRWFQTIKALPSTIRAYEKAEALNNAPTVDDDAHKVLFGQTARRG
jgi:GST-like protein